MEATLRTLIALAFTGLLVLLRLEADRFGAAEYVEADRDGERPASRRQLAWYLLGIGLIGAVWFSDPAPDGQLFLRLGDPGAAILWGFLLGGLGIGQGLLLARRQPGPFRPPDAEQYPRAVLISAGTALVDELTFRGALLGLLVVAGLDPLPAVVIQTLVYALATRLGKPGRDRVLLARSLVIGLVAGYATLATGGIGAAFVGHLVTRIAMFTATGHVGQDPTARSMPAVSHDPRVLAQRRRTGEGTTGPTARPS